MRNASLRKLTVGTVAAGLLLTGCGTTAEGGAASGGGGSEEGPISGLRVMVPNSPGSGYDTTARSVDWATVTAATPTRTTHTMTTCSASSWPASESRRGTGTPDWSGTWHAI